MLLFFTQPVIIHTTLQPAVRGQFNVSENIPLCRSLAGPSLLPQWDLGTPIEEDYK